MIPNTWKTIWPCQQGALTNLESLPPIPTLGVPRSLLPQELTFALQKLLSESSRSEIGSERFGFRVWDSCSAMSAECAAFVLCSLQCAG